ncbi:hypothetical protein LCGC14_1733620, partial [marine sediment metagenome]
MGLSPGIQSFLLGKKLKEDEEKAKVEQQQKQEEFKQKQQQLNLNRRILEAQIKRDEAQLRSDNLEVEQVLNEDKISALQGQRPLIRGVQESMDLFPDPNSGQAPIEQQESSIFQGLQGEIEIPQEELETAQQFSEEQIEQALGQARQESIAKAEGSLLRDDLKFSADIELANRKSFNTRAEDELKHQDKLEEITLQGRQRIEI